MPSNGFEIFLESLRKAVNANSMEGKFGDVPDHILAEFMTDCAEALGKAVRRIKEQEGK